MNRILTIICSTIVLLLIVGVMLFFSRTLIAGRVLSNKLGVPVKIEQFNIVPGRISINNAKLKNAKGYLQPYALTIGSTVIKAPLRNFASRVVQIDSVDVSNIILTLELTRRNVTDNNWTALLSEIQNEEPRIDPHGKNRHANIKKLVLRNLTVRIYKSPRSFQDKVIPRLEFNNVETKDGDLTRRIMQAIIYELIFNIRNILKLPLQVSQDAFNGVINKVDNINIPFLRRND